MKLNKLMLATVIAFSAVSVAQAAPNQGGGTVTFDGDIIDAPCSVAPESVEQTVPMGQISSKVLANEGKSSSEAFNITLKDCNFSTQRSVKIAFTGLPADGNSELLGLAGTARGAGIQLVHGTNEKIAIDGTQISVNNLNAGDNILRFAAYLQGSSATDPVEPGDFTSVVNFTLTYP
ncbi:fimbria A protein [Chania multitudinisentens RB-25]|uniref:Fimbria A protein n=1 Tax=Chania multitudinisentens RB-25 TaxID=1441930 RepID=W0LCN9_9GAMM|nr:fimbrial protein [Chania multitudinisentens]AHG20037.1 fimbria A protein [Chania multitudinisentens RB-25]